GMRKVCVVGGGGGGGGVGEGGGPWLFLVRRVGVGGQSLHGRQPVQIIEPALDELIRTLAWDDARRCDHHAADAEDIYWLFAKSPDEAALAVELVIAVQ